MGKTQLSSWTRENLGHTLSHIVSKYLQDSEHRREFETWYEKTYGKKYIWKKGSVSNELRTQKHHCELDS